LGPGSGIACDIRYVLSSLNVNINHPSEKLSFNNLHAEGDEESINNKKKEEIYE
jgi:hypothetical protein